MIARALRDALATDPAVIATFVRHAPLIDAHLDAHDAELLAVERADPTPAPECGVRSADSQCI